MFDLNKSEIAPVATRIAVAIGGFGLLGVFFFGGKLFWVLWVGLMAALIVWALIQDRRRTKLIREFASRSGFSFLDDRLPKSFPIQGTSSRWAHSITRALAGDKNKREVLCSTVGSGTEKEGSVAQLWRCVENPQTLVGRGLAQVWKPKTWVDGRSFMGRSGFSGWMKLQNLSLNSKAAVASSGASVYLMSMLSALLDKSRYRFAGNGTAPN